MDAEYQAEKSSRARSLAANSRGQQEFDLQQHRRKDD
jgi:hypothetical protein